MSKTNWLVKALDKLSFEIVKNLCGGEEIELIGGYSVYRYYEDEMIVIRNSEDEEVIVVQFGLGKELVFTEI